MMNEVEAVARKAATATPGRPMLRNRAMVPRGPSRTSMKAIRNRAAQTDRHNTTVQLSGTAMNRAMAPPKLQVSADAKTRATPRSRSPELFSETARVDVILPSSPQKQARGRRSGTIEHPVRAMDSRLPRPSYRLRPPCQKSWRDDGFVFLPRLIHYRRHRSRPLERPRRSSRRP